MASEFRVDAQLLEQVSGECKVNAPKILSVFDADVLETLKKAYEETNIENIRKIYEKVLELKEKAAEPIADSIKEVGKILDEQLEKHRQIVG